MGNGQDKGSIFGGLTQMVVPSAQPPQTTPPPAPSFDHLNAIQVAPPTGASKIPDSPSIGQKVQQVAEDIIPLSHEARTLQEQVVNPSKSGQQANELVHEQLSHPERMVMGGVEAEGMGELPGAIGSAIEGAASHVRTQPIDADVREGLLNAVQQKVQAKGAVQQADRAGAEDLANRQPYVAPQREPNYVYRSRDIGEQGVPANENSHAQLTSSEDQARLYTQPGQRDAVTGKPQELVRVDLNKLRPSDYSTKKMDEGVNWHKLKRDVPEELVEKMPVDYHAIGKQQGVDFRGVQKGYGVTSDVAIFQDPQSGTSVGVPLEKWSPAKLAEHVFQARQRMAGTPSQPVIPSEVSSGGVRTTAPGTARTVFDLERQLVGRGIPQERIGELRHAAMGLKDQMEDTRPWDDFYTDFLKRNLNKVK